MGRINKTLYLLNYIDDEDIARLSPLCHGYINMLGHCNLLSVLYFPFSEATPSINEVNILG
ncbi:hypothetical protein PT277_10330 [Acetobacteraceae bacterium ESL0709]|nr:hypothetical protein [Acetobacteraceae bacterium ESL0697]MDF7679076.1 hypothetical protein [Acetobacteraceae bacterium ESL0709]